MNRTLALALPPISSRPGAGGELVPTSTRETRAAAQKAFFQAALNRAQASAPTTAQPDSRAAARPGAQTAAPTGETAPDRPLRPGSIINIVV